MKKQLIGLGGVASVIFIFVCSLNAFGADMGAIASGEIDTGSLQAPAYQDTSHVPHLI